MDKFPEILWQNIIDLTDNILEHAENQQWEQLQEIQKERDDLINQYFEKHTQEPEKIKEVLTKNEKTIELINKNQHIIGKALSEINHLKQRNDAYEKIKAQYQLSPEDLMNNQ